MSYVDLAVGVGIFLFFLAIVLMLSIQHFAQIPATFDVAEYRDAAVEMFERFFKTEGTPNDWESLGELPSELGLITFVYRIPISVEEKGVAARTDEPVIVNLEFDENCDKEIWNNSIRVYDSNLNEIKYELVNPLMCSGQLINQSNIRFKVNISQSDNKVFYVYYINDSGLSSPDHVLSYSTSSWISNGGDSWTESTSSWNRYGGASGSVSTNSTHKISGTSSLQIKGTFDNDKLGLIYQPGSSISDVENGWYVDMWIYVENMADVSSVDISLDDGSDTIVSSVSAGLMENEEWYHLERNISSSEWTGWSTFNASNGIAQIMIYMVNSTPGVTKSLKVDDLHFELRPLEVKSFAEEVKPVVSRKKVDALSDLDYEKLREILEEDYRFRIEIIDD